MNRATTAACSIAIACLTNSALAQAEPAGGYRAHNVVQQFQSIATHGDPIGINLVPGALDPNQCQHYQGILRCNGPDGTPHFILTRNGNIAFAAFCSTNTQIPGEMTVARMDSRPHHRERMRSNRLRRDEDMQYTTPPSTDRLVWGALYGIPEGEAGHDYPASLGTDCTSRCFDDVDTSCPIACRAEMPPNQYTFLEPQWFHPGDGQIVDGIMVIPFEAPFNDDDDIGALAFYDVSDPGEPLFLRQTFFSCQIGVLGVALDPFTGRHLFAMTSKASNEVLFYESNVEHLASDNLRLTFVDEWSETELGNDRNKWLRWQNLDFIREAGTEQLYLAAAGKASQIGTGDDWVRLYEFQRSGSQVSLTQRAERKLLSGGPDMGNTQAASSFYVSPSGQLILYVGGYESDGPDGSIEVGEYRSLNVTTSGASVSNRPWIELYRDPKPSDPTGLWLAADQDRSLMIDQIDIGSDDFNYLTNPTFGSGREDGCGDEAHAIRWWGPPGAEITLFDETDGGGDGSIVITCGGNVQWFSDLDGSWLNDDPATGVYLEGWGDKIEVVRMRNLHLGDLIEGVDGGWASLPAVLANPAGFFVDGERFALVSIDPFEFNGDVTSFDALLPVGQTLTLVPAQSGKVTFLP